MLIRTMSMTVAMLLAGCANLLPPSKSIGERNSGFAYIPLDPLPVYVAQHPSCREVVVDGRFVLAHGYEAKPLLDSLPDNAVRIAVKEYNSKGNLSFGGSSVGSEGNRYQVVLDYINVDTSNIRFLIRQPKTPIDTRVDSISIPPPEVVRIPPDSNVDRD